MLSRVFSPAVMPMLHTSFGYSLLGMLIEEPTPDALTAYEKEYARRAGYEVGADGEWIAQVPARWPADY